MPKTATNPIIDALRRNDETFRAGLVNTFLTDDRVSHDKYGLGTIRDTADHYCTVMFDNAGVGLRKIVHTHLRIAPPSAANDNKERLRFDLTWFDDIDHTATKETFIKDVLGNGEFTVVSGLPGSGKSVILTDMACHVAAGMEWMGRRVDRGFVLYVAAERKKLTERRMIAFRKHHDVHDVPLLVMGGSVDFTSSATDAKAIAAVANEAAAECGLPCLWVIIDTLTRTFGPGDQNTSKDMVKFVRSCDTLIEDTGAHVTVVHHTPWSGERGKGAIDLDGAVDASFLVKDKGGSYELSCDGANDMDEGVVCHFKMQDVEIGRNDDGEPTGAPVVIESDGKTAGQHLVEGMQRKAADVVLRVLEELSDDGHLVGGGMWLAKYQETEPDKKPEAMKTRFYRARRELLDNAKVQQVGDAFIPVSVSSSVIEN